MADLFKIILIETHNACTRRCWFCKFGQTRQDGHDDLMDWELIERIIFNLEALDYDGRISWFWINEPLLDARMVEILKLGKRHCPNAFQSLVTNGDLLDGLLYRELRSNGLDALAVSVYDDSTLERIKVIPNDGRLVMFDMRRAEPGQLENRAGSIKSKAEDFEIYHKRFMHKTCDRPFNMMTINPRGEVVLCCADMYGDVVMGDLKRERLETVWNKKSFTRYRTLLKEEGRRNLELCRDCSHNGSCNTVLYPLQTKSGSFREPLDS